VSVENFAMMEINEKIAVAVVQAAVVEVHVAAVHLVVVVVPVVAAVER
jgi:hypothetical protein